MRSRVKTQIINEKDYLRMIAEKSLVPVPVNSKLKLDAELSLSENDFLSYAQSKDSEVFYCYTYPKISEIIITPETFSTHNEALAQLVFECNLSDRFMTSLDKEIYPEYYEGEDDAEIKLSSFEKKLLRRILNSNSRINSQEHMLPKHFSSACLVQGRFVGIERDAGFDHVNLAEKALEGILLQHEQEAVAQSNKSAEKVQQIKDRLREYLLGDKEFLQSTNKNLREEYGLGLWRNKEFKWIKEAFDSGYGGYPGKSFFNYLDRVYNDYRCMKSTLPRGT